VSTTVARRQVSDPDTQRALDEIRARLDEVTRLREPPRAPNARRGGNLLSARAEASGVPNTRHIGDTALANAVIVKLKHGLGRRLRGWIVTDLRGPSTSGRIERILDDALSTDADDGEDLWLKATGWGATITVRVLVY
jgi:hypothetical protein